jgi:hypothetical protein
MAVKMHSEFLWRMLSKCGDGWKWILIGMADLIRFCDWRVVGGE